MRKNVSEFIGTFVLVFLGCGTAMLVGCDPASGTGYLLTALAFGLALIACAYSVGNISGCHINPAVSIGMYFAHKLSFKNLISYICSQCLGAICGSACLGFIFSMGRIPDMTGNSLGSNGYGAIPGSGAPVVALIVEIILTFIFMMAIFGVGSAKANHGSFAGLIIGLTLIVVHIFGIKVTGTSVNPARSLGPAIMRLVFHGNASSLAELWVFIVGPIIGAVAAAFVFNVMEEERKEREKRRQEAANRR